MTAALRSSFVALLVAVCSCGTSTAPADRTVTVPAAPVPAAYLSFWVDVDVGDSVAVTLDNALAGYITRSHSTAPACRGTGVFTVEVTPGIHTISAAGGGLTWNTNNTPNVLSGQCQLLRFSTAASERTRLLFWTNAPITSPINVVIDDLLVGQITRSYSSRPPCGAAGSVTTVLTPAFMSSAPPGAAPVGRPPSPRPPTGAALCS